MKSFARAPPRVSTPSSSGSKTASSSSHTPPVNGRSTLREGSSASASAQQASNRRSTTHTPVHGSSLADHDDGLSASGSGLRFSTPSGSSSNGTPSHNRKSTTALRQSLPAPMHDSSLYSTPIQNRSVLRARSTNAPLTSFSPSLIRNNSDPALLFSPSSIIPFDAEGNKQAGLEAEARAEAIRAGRGEGLNSVDGTPVNPRRTLFGGPKRVIRKRGWWDRITSYPIELMDRFTPDTFHPSPSYAPVLSLLLHLIHFLVRAPLRQSYKVPPVIGIPAGGAFGFGETGLGGPIVPVGEREGGRKSRWERGGAVGSGRGLTAVLGSWLVFLILLAIAVANAAYVFQSKRTYHMRLRGERPIDSPNARAVPDPASFPSNDLFPASPLSKAWTFSKRYLSPMPVIRLALGKDMFVKKAGEDAGRAMVQRLEVWDPPAFNFRFFSSYSPLTPLLFQLLAVDHWFYAVLFNLLLHFQTQFLVEQYQQLVKDKQILQSEVMREYDEVFVKRKVFSTRVDAGVQTDFVFAQM